MPAIIAVLLRQVVMAVATGAIVTGAQELLDGSAKELVYEIRDTEGVTEQDAKDVVANIFSDLAVNSATIFATLKLGIGVKTAGWLGLTSRGLAKKALTGKAATVATKLAASGGKVVATSLFKRLATIAAIPASLIWLASALANIIEPGIYKARETNALYKKLGIPFQYPVTDAALKPGPFSSTGSVTFSDFALSLEAAGIKGISNPVARTSEVYSREGLADVVNYVYGQETLNGKALSTKELLPKIAPYLIGMTKAVETPTTTTTATTSTPTTKVFTGVVSQGVVGAGLVFEARPDDLIESVDELRVAAVNNLAPYLATLPGKIVYEVKIVSSVISKDGFTQRGTTQRIQTGTYQNGTPKYKTVTNKFATLVLYALTDKGSRAKLTTIVLGPVDSAKVAVAQSDIQALEVELPDLVTTTDINDIASIQTTTPVAVTYTQQTRTDGNGNSYNVSVPTPTTGVTYPYTLSNGNIIHAGWSILGPAQGGGYRLRETDGSEKLLPEKDYNLLNGISSTPVPVTASPVTPSTAPATPATPSQKLGANATTLSEWYQAHGWALPTIQIRATLYQNLGLGQSSYYTGTAEQNTKLLNALKAQEQNQ